MAHRRASRLLSLLVVMSIAACSSGDIGANVGPDPTSLEEFSGLGGATYEPLDSLGAAALADVAVEVEIVDIKRTHLNTQDGQFPSTEQLERLGIGDLTALTDVDVRIRKFLGSAKEGLSFDEGSITTITVGGGLYQTLVVSRQAELLGLTEVVNGPFPEHTEGETGPPDVEEEVPVQGDAIPFTWGSSPEELSFAEGDVLVVFLVEHEIPGYDTGNLVLVGPIHPMGVLVEDGIGWKVQGTDDNVELDALIQALGSSNS